MTPLQSMTFFVLVLVVIICLLIWLIEFVTWVIHRRDVDVDVDVAEENSDPETAKLTVVNTSDEPYDYEIHGL